MKLPRLSIITINLNNAAGLAKTLSSVWEDQSFSDLEQIVIDGASHDGSMDVIRKFETNIAEWISEPDKGIYNAMNKGIARAKGEYLLFLNSGDELVPDVLANVFKCKLHGDIVYGDICYCEKSGNQNVVKFPPEITFRHLYTSYLPHPCSFIKRTLFDKKQYHEGLKIVSDWAFFIETILFLPCTTQYIPEVITFFDTTGISNNNSAAISERNKILEQLFSVKGKEYIDHAMENEQVLDAIFGNKKQLLKQPNIQRFLRKSVRILSPIFYFLKQK